MLLGIDIGTSSVKAMLMEPDGRIIAVKTAAYQVEIPHPGWAQQHPDTWWEGLCRILGEMKAEHPRQMEGICGIGLSGQMHGLVAVDREGQPVCPAVIWMDQRAEEETREIEEKISRKEQGEILHNRIFNGFALPSLLWMRKREGGLYRKIFRIFQPKDYIRFRLTGEMGTEYSDASASLMMDVGKRVWAEKLLEKLGIEKNILTELHESVQVAGSVTAEASRRTGLREGIPVVFGAGDQQAQSIGNGAAEEGMLISNIGTGAQISAFSRTDFYDPQLRTHTFCHGISGAYTVYGAMLTGGMSLQWLKDQILKEKSFSALGQMAESIRPGSDGLLFLPYLAGERTPLMDPQAKGVFFGLTLGHQAGHLVRAVMEGVTFALKDSLEIMEEIGIRGEQIIASGGAANSPVWLQIQADILGKTVRVSRIREQACLGACILAGVGCGIYRDVTAAGRELAVLSHQVYEPRKEFSGCYEELYRKFHGIYQGTREYMVTVRPPEK